MKIATIGIALLLAGCVSKRQMYRAQIHDMEIVQEGLDSVANDLHNSECFSENIRLRYLRIAIAEQIEVYRREANP